MDVLESVENLYVNCFIFLIASKSHLLVGLSAIYQSFCISFCSYYVFFINDFFYVIIKAHIFTMAKRPHEIVY